MTGVARWGSICSCLWPCCGFFEDSVGEPDGIGGGVPPPPTIDWSRVVPSPVIPAIAARLVAKICSGPGIIQGQAGFVLQRRLAEHHLPLDPVPGIRRGTDGGQYLECG